MVEKVPIWNKAMLTLEEAASYTGIGVNKLRDLSNSKDCNFVLWNGSRRLLYSMKGRICMCKSIIWGYARISTMKQKLERQIDNIRREYPEAVIITEEYTGTTTDRPKWNKLVEQISRITRCFMTWV